MKEVMEKTKLTFQELKELTDMAIMYCDTCTKQEEKFEYHKRNGCTWQWKDCQAAYELLDKELGWLFYEIKRQVKRM